MSLLEGAPLLALGSLWVPGEQKAEAKAERGDYGPSGPGSQAR